LDIINDFKAIEFFRFGEINRSLFRVFSKKFSFLYILKCNNQPKEIEKTQSNDLFISPKWKNSILEMSLKSSIISKLDRQMSKR
jgi:hypothetical protein